MDVLSIVRDGIEKLPEGGHPGLKAVVNHIEVAIRHLHIGQSSGDDQLYTDAVYRCNQAFEGSLKELYRVVSGKEPNKITPQKIEEFLEKSNTLRPKVIIQLKRYRQEWRNPSTHDYTLDFDEDEAFLAIVNIAAFAKTAISQIASSIAFDVASQTKIISAPLTKAKRTQPSDDALIEAVSIYAAVYFADAGITPENEPRVPEGQIASILAGFLSSIENLEVELESPIVGNRPMYADIMVKRGNERCLVELRSEKSMAYHSARGLEQLRIYMEAGDIDAGVLAIYAHEIKRYSIMTASTLTRTIKVVLPTEMVDDAIRRWPEYNFDRYDI